MERLFCAAFFKAFSKPSVQSSTCFISLAGNLVGGMMVSVLPLIKKKDEPKAESDMPAEAPKKKNNLGNIAMVAMFIGLCIAYLSFYLAGFILKPAQYLPLAVTIIAAAIMYLFTALAKKPKLRWLENFDIALSMLLAMAAAVVINLVF